MCEDRNFVKLIYLLASLYGLVNISIVAAHPQSGPGDGNISGKRGSLVVSTNIGTLRYTAPENYDYTDLPKERSISSAELIVDGDYGFVFSGDLPLVVLPDDDDGDDGADEDTKAEAEAEEGFLTDGPNFNTDANFAPTLYPGKPQTFNPAFLATRAIYFKLPSPADANKQIILWLEYMTNAGMVKKIARLNFERQDDGSRVAQRLPEQEEGAGEGEGERGVEVLSRAAILHAPPPSSRGGNVLCSVEFGSAWGNVVFTPRTPFNWPVRAAERIVCFDDVAA